MKQKLSIGYIPTIDHLILGVAAHTDTEHDLSPKLFTSWSDMTDTLMKGDIDGAFLLFPLGFELFRQDPSIRLILLGHREGQLLVAGNHIKTISDLKSKTVFVPDVYSTHHILLHKILKSAELSLEDITLKTGFSHPKDMITMLQDGSIDAFVAAEPMGTYAEEEKAGHIMTLSHDVAPHHVDCVLMMREKALTDKKEAVQELVESLVQAGLFINAYPRQAAEIGEPFLGWPKKLLLRAITHDRAHILFWDLLPRPEEFKDFHTIALKDMHLWDTPIDVETCIEASFAQHAYREWVIDTRKSVKDRGENRTLPGNFTDAAQIFKKLFNAPHALAGFKTIKPKEAYPKNITRIDALPTPRIDFLNDVLDGIEYTLLTPEAKNKGIAFFTPQTNITPDRILLRTQQEPALKILQTLGWGKQLTEVPSYNEATADKDLFTHTESVSAVQHDSSVYFSIDFTTFRFLTLLLHYF